jgi:hypothetical protein
MEEYDMMEGEVRSGRSSLSELILHPDVSRKATNSSHDCD